jgi:hypothetical protein
MKIRVQGNDDLGMGPNAVRPYSVPDGIRSLSLQLSTSAVKGWAMYLQPICVTLCYT